MDILIDTNIALHFKRLDQIDWCELAGVAKCSLIVTPVLMRELERNKVHNPNAKLRQRAKDTISWLADRLREEDPIRLRKAVTLTFDDQEPLLDFAEHRLSRDIADDHLIASGLDWAQRTGHDVAIASADNGIALKLRSRPLGFLQPDGKWRLPDAVDAERAELRELRKELERERNRRALLSVHFENGEKTLSIGPEPIDPPQALNEIVSAHPEMTLDEFTALDDRTGPGVRVYSRELVDQYNQDLSRYFVDYERYLMRHAEWAKQEQLTLEVAFSLANTGSAPASNIDVEMYFPDHIEIISLDDASDEPIEPASPIKPRPNQKAALMLRTSPRPDPFLTPSIPVEGEPTISRDRRTAEYSFRALKHDCASELEPVLVRFPSRELMRPFEIEVSITCNETAKVVERLLIHPIPYESEQIEAA
jgi:hypothetical protein